MFIANDFINELIFSEKPSLLLEFLRNNNLIGKFPELNSLIGCLHEPFWHPEGDVWTHTLMVIDAAAELRQNFNNNDDKLSFMLGALCHDLGKPYTNDFDRGRIRSIMHDQYGIVPTETLLRKFEINNPFIIKKVLAYTRYHLVPMQFHASDGKVSDKAVKRLHAKIHIPDLVQLTRADHWGRTDEEAINKICHAADYLMERYIRIFG